MSTTEKTVRVSMIKISNILGISEASIQPGKVTLIQGANGKGKTSLLEAIRAGLTGGHDASLIRKGSDKAEVVLVLDDGTEITKAITAAGSRTKVSHPDFGPLSKPATYLDKLRDTLSLNPIDFLVAKKDRQLELLLSAIPLRIQANDIADVLALCSTKPNLDRHALEVLAGIEKDLYEQRTGLNRSLKDKRTAAEEMRKALPPESSDGADWHVRLTEDEQRLRLLLEDTAEQKTAVELDITHRYNKIMDLRRDHVRTLEQERDAEIAKIRAQYADKIESANRASTETADALRAEKDQRISALGTGAAEQRVALERSIAEARANADTYNRAQAARDHIRKLEEGAAALESDSRLLTDALDNVSAMKGDLLDKLPIKGVEIRESEIYVDGIPFDRVNESRRVRLAIEMALLRAGSLPLMCCDGIERLDSASLEALEQYAAERNIQLVLSRVTDGDLDVRIIA